jgi:CoA-transferase family III
VATCSGGVVGESREASFREEFWELLAGADLGAARSFADTRGAKSRRAADIGYREGGAEGGPDCELLDWAASGLMDLSGWSGRPPVGPPSPVMGRVRGVASVLGSLGETIGRRPTFDLHALVAGRAASVGLHRSGRRSASGTCRLVAAEDGWLAVNLARPEDLDGLSAALRQEALERPWDELQSWAAAGSASEVVETLQLLGVPAAMLPSAGRHTTTKQERPGEWPTPPPFRSYRIGREAPVLGHPLTVVNLASLWAGPLCGYLLATCGTRVLNIESSSRPDGLRFGAPAFFDFLHQYDEPRILELPSAGGVEELRTLLRSADLVIEGSRPRALAQMGIDVEEVVRERPGVTWVSITAHGRRGDAANLVGFGDDTAVGGGLVGRDGDGKPVFCGDALADPLTGLYAAAAGAASIISGGGRLVEVTMSSVAAHVATGSGPTWEDHALVVDGRGGWNVACGSWSQPVSRPSARLAAVSSQDSLR